MHAGEMREIARLLAADLGSLRPGVAVSVEPGPTSLLARELDRRGIPRTGEPGASSDWPVWVPEVDELAIIVRTQVETVSTWEFAPAEEPTLDVLVRGIGAVQTDVIESLWAPWPRCPALEHPHPLELTVLDGRIAWACPAENGFIAWFGGLAATIPGA